MHNILLYPREKDEDHKVMSATDTSNQENDSDNDNLTEDENSYEDNAQENIYMVNKEKSGKTSTSKKGDKDTDKVTENPIKIVIDSKKKSKEEEETKEDTRKLAEVTKLFRNLAQGLCLRKKELPTIRHENSCKHGKHA